MDYRAATPADEPFLRAMLWHAYNWRDESAAADHWPDPHGPRRYVEGFGRPGDGGVIAEEGGEPAGAAWYRLLPARRRGLRLCRRRRPRAHDRRRPAVPRSGRAGFEPAGGSGGSVTLMAAL